MLTRRFIMKPSGHAGATQKGCVSRPIERYYRRSWVHRPTIGDLGSPPVACVISRRISVLYVLVGTAMTLFRVAPRAFGHRIARWYRGSIPRPMRVGATVFPQPQDLVHYRPMSRGGPPARCPPATGRARSAT